MEIVEGGGPSCSDDQQQQQQQARKHRLARACTARTSARLAPLAPTVQRPVPRKTINNNKDRESFTVLTTPPPPSQRRRWLLRNMWEFASVLNFLHVFRPFLNINVEFSAEELETALITPNSTLDEIHIPLLKAIPPVSRIALGRGTWVTVLCKKLKDWWFWVAEGELPIVAAHGEEIAAYKELDPETRVLILKALCEIRVEKDSTLATPELFINFYQEDIRNYIDDSVKHGVQLSAFRNERIGGDSHGTSFWYEDDATIGHRLYREIRKIEVKNRMKGKGSSSEPVVTCQWETIATNFDEFQVVSEKLASSKSKMEAGLGKKLKNDILPELEKLQKRKERVLKKQQRQAMLLDSFLSTHGPTSGRSLRDRKPVRYTFDDYDRSINEAIKITKKGHPSPDLVVRKDVARPENPAVNGHLQNSNDTFSPKFSNGSGESDAEHTSGPLTRSNRRRRRPQRYSEKEFVEAVSDNEADFDSDEEIVGEAVYDDEYMRSRKRRKASSSSEGDEEYRGDEENVDEEEDEDDDEEEEDEEEDDAVSTSEDVDDRYEQKWGKRPLSGRKKKGRKLRSVDELQSGLRRSKRATRTNVDYSKYDMSNSEEEYVEDYEKSVRSSDETKNQSDISNSIDYDMEHDNSLDEVSEKPSDEKQLHKAINTVDVQPQKASAAEMRISNREVIGEQPIDVRKRRFIDLNELAPVTGLDDSPAA